MSVSFPTLLKSRLRRLFRALAVFLILLSAGFFLVKRKWYPGPPIPTAVLSPVGPTGHREWSKIVFHYPGCPAGPKDREWSHWEIAQRHKALVLKDLPDYVTELRGSGAADETPRTAAGWFFVVPKQYLPEFEQYILDLGVPPGAMHAVQYIPLPEEYHDWNLHPPAVPILRLLFGTSEKAAGEGPIMNMMFGKSSATMAYYLVNPNLGRATARIMVAWASGNVQFLEMPIHPYEE